MTKMTDYEAMSALRQEQAKETRLQGRLNRAAATEDFATANDLAVRHGLRLSRLSDTHYQLTDGSWLINVYPGNCRLFADKKKARAPFLDVPKPWVLDEVVNAAVRALAAEDAS